MVKRQNVFARKKVQIWEIVFRLKSFFLTKQSVGAGEQIINIIIY